MRGAFVKTLIELAEQDNRVCLLTGDLGFHALEEFREKFPDRFVNCGVAEQNMMGVAAGLAMCGKKPYVYSIVPFITLRCLEQIRNDVCYQNLDVKIIGIGGGFSYGTLGATHSVLEEVAILRALPHMTVLCPADLLSTEELTLKSYQSDGPTYIRTSKIDKGQVYSQKPNLEIGKPNVVKEGKDNVIVATGLPVFLAQKAAEELKNQGIDLKVIDFHTLKPIDKEYFFKEIKDSKKIFTIEEHSLMGGTGAAVAEILMEFGWRGELKKIASPDQFPSEIGQAEYLRKRYIIDEEKIVKTILKFL